jgi:hypothetical protein
MVPGRHFSGQLIAFCKVMRSYLSRVHSGGVQGGGAHCSAESALCCAVRRQRTGGRHSNIRIVASSWSPESESRMEWMRRRSVSGASSPAAVARTT